MGRIDRVIFIQNAVETLGYFSAQLALEFEQNGFAVYFVDYKNLDASVSGLAHFAARGKTALLTFNFIGLSGESFFLQEDGRYIWEYYDMQYINILVDHPLYYHSRLEHAPGRMKVFCIDRDHVAYIRRFYPEIRARFLPTAGNVMLESLPYGDRSRDYWRIWNYEEELAPIAERKYDIVFTGNNVPIRDIERKIDAMEDDYRVFYHNMIDDLMADPGQRMEEAMERHVKEELGEVGEKDLRSAMAGMVFVDICVRSRYRAAIIRELAEQGLSIHVLGAGWELLHCRKLRNVAATEGMADSNACVKAIRNAKITLNIMPWFKCGAHDRIFTAMLQKSVALTDKSRYLREEFTDGDELVFYELERYKELPSLAEGLLREPGLLQRIAEKGYESACRAHSWRNRAQELRKALEER